MIFAADSLIECHSAMGAQTGNVLSLLFLRLPVPLYALSEKQGSIGALLWRYAYALH